MFTRRKLDFSKLLRRVQSGQEVIIAKASKPIARIVPLGEAAQSGRVFGAFKDWIECVPDAFDVSDEVGGSLRERRSPSRVMRVLLDTHAIVWWATGDARLSRKARVAISNPDTEVFISIASAWEIQIKADATEARAERISRRAVSGSDHRPRFSDDWDRS